MRLSELSQSKSIVIQCHDNPDPDTIAAGYGLYKYFMSKGNKVRLIYSGKLLITKPNILLFIEALKIPIEHVTLERVPGLLITVDCQYGAGNVTHIIADDIAIIDHHIQDVPAIKNQEIRIGLASTSTIIWDLLLAEGFEVNKDLSVSTALYYGLLSDSSSLAEVTHPLDKDMRDTLIYDKYLIRKLKTSILSLQELEIAGIALIRHVYNEAYKYVLIKSKSCDSNMLGLISDFSLQVDCVNVCVVYSVFDEGIKYSEIG